MATINIRLNKNFTTQLNKLKEEFGEDFEVLNGLSDIQLSFCDFIDNFIDKETVADASVDGNANVSHKDIVTLLNEMPKPHRKLLAYNKIYYEIQKLYDFKPQTSGCARSLQKRFICTMQTPVHLSHIVMLMT